MVDSDPHEDRGYVLLSSVYPIAALATAVLVARVIARRMRNIELGLDDYTIIFGWVLAWIVCVNSTLLVQEGVGKHLEAVENFDQVHMLRTLYWGNHFYLATGPVNKFAVLLLYRRIFTIPRFSTITTIIMVLLVVWYLVMALMGVFICIPVQAYWDKSIEGARCIGLLPYDIGYAVINISSDIIILALPIPMIWNLRTTTAQKIALSVVFLLGGLTCVTALIRLLTSILEVENPDVTWVYLDAALWTAIEPSIGVISACLPTLWPVVAYFLPRRHSDSSLQDSPPECSRRSNMRSYPHGWTLVSKRFGLSAIRSLPTMDSDADRNLTNNEADERGHASDSDMRDLNDGEIRVVTEVEVSGV